MITGPGATAPTALLPRVPAGVKIIALAVLGVLVYLVDAHAAQLGLLAGAVLALLLSGIRPGPLLRSVLGLLVFVAVVVLVTTLTDSVDRAVTNGLRLLTVFCFALAVTSSTSTTALLDLLDRLLGPLSRIGLPARRISLAITLTIRFVPEIRSRYLEIREAQYARGLHNRPVAILVPLLVRTFTDAEDIAAALDARCWDADVPGTSSSTGASTTETSHGATGARREEGPR